MAINDIKTTFGSSVRVSRKRLGISQEELAGRAGLHRTYVSDVERGARNVSLESIEKLARALEVPIAELVSANIISSSALKKEASLSPAALVDILFIEDREDDVELAMQALQAVGIANRIHLVRDGEEALHYLFCTGRFADRLPSERPQMILLDLGLPKIGGLEVLRQIKADPRTRDIPVIVLTASSRDRDVLNSKRLGAQAYIVKPVDLLNLSEVTPKLSFQWALLKTVPSSTREPTPLQS